MTNMDMIAPLNTRFI